MPYGVIPPRYRHQERICFQAICGADPGCETEDAPLGLCRVTPHLK